MKQKQELKNYEIFLYFTDTFFQKRNKKNKILKPKIFSWKIIFLIFMLKASKK